jgi:hypothetical protein
MTAQELMRRLTKLRKRTAADAYSYDVVGSREHLVERLRGVDMAIEVVKHALKEPPKTRGRRIYRGKIDGVL